ncbi:hypothetical protein T484DRAFT_2591787 [Baffinella frigidus]|nr:hypothetical protein T484DRAFT_2591787 [Cryptophyta sp. CCMP2293]
MFAPDGALSERVRRGRARRQARSPFEGGVPSAGGAVQPRVFCGGGGERYPAPPATRMLQPGGEVCGLRHAVPGQGRHVPQAQTLRPPRCTLYTLKPQPSTLNPQPSTLHPTPYTLQTLHPTPYTLHPKPFTPHPTP